MVVLVVTRKKCLVYPATPAQATRVIFPRLVAGPLQIPQCRSPHVVVVGCDRGCWQSIPVTASVYLMLYW